MSLSYPGDYVFRAPMDLGREGQDTFEQSEDDGLTEGGPLGIFLDVVLGTKAIFRSGGKREGGLRKFKLGDFFFS